MLPFVCVVSPAPQPFTEAGGLRLLVPSDDAQSKGDKFDIAYKSIILAKKDAIKHMEPQLMRWWKRREAVRLSQGEATIQVTYPRRGVRFFQHSRVHIFWRWTGEVQYVKVVRVTMQRCPQQSVSYDFNAV